MLNLRINYILLLLTVIVSATPAVGQNNLGLSTTSKKTTIAEWPTLRANNNRDGRVVSTGAFGNEVRFSETLDYSSSEAYVELLPSGKGTSITFGEGEMKKEEEFRAVADEWQLEPGGYFDLYGN